MVDHKTKKKYGLSLPAAQYGKKKRKENDRASYHVLRNRCNGQIKEAKSIQQKPLIGKMRQTHGNSRTL